MNVVAYNDKYDIRLSSDESYFEECSYKMSWLFSTFWNVIVVKLKEKKTHEKKNQCYILHCFIFIYWCYIVIIPSLDLMTINIWNLISYKSII